MQDSTESDSDAPTDDIAPAAIDENELKVAAGQQEPTTGESTDGAEESDPSKTSGGFPWGWLFLLLLLGAAGGASWYFADRITALPAFQMIVGGSQRLQGLQEESQGLQQRSQVQQEELQTLARRVEQVSRSADEVASQGDAIAQIIEQQQVLNERMASAELRVNEQLADWRIYRVRDLLHVADRRLYFDHDLDGALLAFAKADQLLAALDERRWRPLRENIAGLQAELKSLPRADMDGIVIRLQTTAARISRLSPAPVSRPIETAPGQFTGEPADWREAISIGWNRLVHGLGQLVSVRRVTDAEAPLLGHEQLEGRKFYLRGQLMLAEMELLSADSRFQSRVIAVANSLPRYFGADRPEVISLMEELNLISQTPIVSAYPDASQPLVWLDQQMAATAGQ